MALFKKENSNRFKSGFFDHYKISNTVLGEGTYATVVVAYDNKNHIKVAVKTIDKTTLKEKDRRKLQTEVDILKSLHHPHVVKVFDCYEEPNKYYLVMERVKGGTLSDKMKAENYFLSELRVKSYVRQLTDALKYCKDKGIVHRDVKAENILINENEQVKLADFNLAKKLDPTLVNFTVLETMCGTPNYVAPEVLSSRPYDYKCDVWSLGVATYFMLSNNLPFTVRGGYGDETLSDLLDKVREGTWKFVPENRWAQVSQHARDFVFKTLQKNPEKRYGYEQLLGHPWFKRSEQEELEMRIDTSPVLTEKEKRLMLCASTVMEAAENFRKLMNDEEDVDIGRLKPQATTTGESTFNMSMSGF